MKVKLISATNCHVSLPAATVFQLSKDDTPPIPLFLEITPISNSESKAPIFLTWVGDTSGDDLGIPLNLAKNLSISPGTEVSLKFLKPSQVRNAVSINLEPLNHDDWELMELNGEHLETQILSQVKFDLNFKILILNPKPPLSFKSEAPITQNSL